MAEPGSGPPIFGNRSELLEQLMEIRAANGGRLTATVVVDTARDPDHPLHGRFLWDNEEAAERFRVDQARELIRSVRVVYRRPNGDLGRVREFHSIRSVTDGGFAYEPTTEILQDPLMTRILLRQMEHEWRALRQKWERFSEFSELVRGDLDLGETGS